MEIIEMFSFSAKINMELKRRYGLRIYVFTCFIFFQKWVDEHFNFPVSVMFHFQTLKS